MIQIMLARLTNHKLLKGSQGTAKWKKKIEWSILQKFSILCICFVLPNLHCFRFYSNPVKTTKGFMLMTWVLLLLWFNFRHTHLHRHVHTEEVHQTHTWKYILTPNVMCWYQLPVLNWITLWYEVFLLICLQFLLF